MKSVWRKRWIFAGLISLLALFQVVYAEGVPERREGTDFFSMFAGVNWEFTQQVSSIVNLDANNTNLYQFNRTDTTGPFVGLDIGRRGEFGHVGFFSVGLETGYTRVIAGGRVHPLFFINPAFDSLYFTYAISSVPVFAMGQLGWHLRYWCDTYLIGGAGMSWNRASNYNEVEVGPAAAPMQTMYQPYTTLAFAYTIGAGMGFHLSDSTLLGFEYRLSNFGNASLGPTLLQSTSERLNLGSFWSNSLLARMTVLFSS